MPSGAGRADTYTNATKVLISIFYSNPQKLEVHYHGAAVTALYGGLQGYNFSAVKPTVDDPCATNYFAQWENKIYVVLCGGIEHALQIKTVDAITLSIGIEVTVEDFFDPHDARWQQSAAHGYQPAAGPGRA